MLKFLQILENKIAYLAIILKVLFIFLVFIVCQDDFCKVGLNPIILFLSNEVLRVEIGEL